MEIWYEVTRTLEAHRRYEPGERVDVSEWSERRVKQLIEQNRIKPIPREWEPRKKEK